MSGDSDRVDQELVQDPCLKSSLKSSSVKSVHGPVSNGEDEPVPLSLFEKNNARKPRNFLIPSILVSILCFWPLGIAAIWQATKNQSYAFMQQSQQAAKRGEHENAKIHSNVAKSFIIFSMALGILQTAAMVTVVMLQLYVFPRYSYVPTEAIATTVHH